MRIGLGLGIFAVGTVVLSGCVGHRGAPPSTDIDENVYREHVRTLASDEFEGRQPGTHGEERTVAYLVEHFRRLGLKPGNGASYLQAVPLVEITADSQGSLSIQGGGAASALSFGADVLVWTKRAVPEVSLKASELVFVGFGIIAPEYSWNDYAAVDVHGKTVVVLANAPGYAGNSMTEYGRLEYKMEEAARQGAAGVLVVHDPAVTGFSWEAVQAGWSRAQLELARPDGYAGRAALEGWLRRDAAVRLFSAAGLDFATLSNSAAHAGFKPVALNLRADAVLHNAVRAFNSQNVVALLPGGKHHAEYVLYDAHWDHFGIDPNRAGHTIFNGAVDDATGVAGLLTLAQSFVRTTPELDRAIVFLATTGGDYGQLGARYYAENPPLSLRDTAAVFEVDTLRTGGPTRDVSIIGFGNTDLEETARAEALLQGRETHPEPSPAQGRYFQSDAYMFARHGVPVLFAQGGFDNSARGPAYGHALYDDYMTRRFHQPTDVYSADWDVRGALDDLKLYYEAGSRVARSRRFPRWYPNSEFRGSHARRDTPGE